jgi:hypoxanthine-DNA glycosylase
LTATPSSAERKHAFAPVVDAGTRLLVCGSLPGDRSLAAQRYYAHPQNHFWRLLSAVIELDLQSLDYDARLPALLARHIGLWDVIASATRVGSSDATIRDRVSANLTGLAASLPELRAIAFNGGTAWRHGSRQLAGSSLPLVPLPSSSPLHTIGFDAKLPAWLELGRYL